MTPKEQSKSVAILVPVMGRPKRIAPLLANIREATIEPHTVYFTASDAPTVLELRNAGAKHWTDAGDTYANRMNRMVRETTEPYVFLGADDYLFYPGWLTPLLDAQHELEAVDGIGGVTTPDDLHNPAPTCFLIARSYIETLGGCVDAVGIAIHPGYRHCFCDNELVETAESRGKLRKVSESIVEHLHPAASKGENDATYVKGMSSWAEDEALFFSRRPLWA